MQKASKSICPGHTPLPKMGHSHYLWGRYYDMLGNVYDEKLKGRYDEGMGNDIYKHLFHTQKKAITHLEKSSHPNSRDVLARIFFPRQYC